MQQAKSILTIACHGLPIHICGSNFTHCVDIIDKEVIDWVDCWVPKNTTYSRIYKTDLFTIFRNIEYITKNVKKNVHSLFISDLNFGMIPGDLDTCNVLAKMQEQYNYPQKILSTTGKNNKERIIDSIKSLNGSLALSMSVQSMDEGVLKNIQRDNISVDRMLGLAPTIKESGLRTTAEIIVGLPGETYDSHLDTIRQLVGAKLDDVIIYTCFLLTGSEMATPEQQSKWKFQTKHRILPMDFAKLSNDKNICEIDNVIIGSKDLSFDEATQEAELKVDWDADFITKDWAGNTFLDRVVVGGGVQAQINIRHQFYKIFFSS